MQGQNILAVKVTEDATRAATTRDQPCSTRSLQHAREWITAGDEPPAAAPRPGQLRQRPGDHRLVDTTELWFVPVANPDGYDYTFTEGNRLWRKNLRDNDGDGQITVGRRRRPQPQLRHRSGATTTRAPRRTRPATPTAARRPLRAGDPGAGQPVRRVGFEFFINYHSAAELLLYGIGWQVSTPSPDDVIYEAMAGTDDNPAVPGYDPDISAELYTTNGDTDTHATVQYGTLGFTPEMSTCEAASDSIPTTSGSPRTA